MMWTGWWSLVWTFAWLCTTAAQGPTANATVAMLLDLEVTSGLYAALRRHAGRLSVRYNVNITLDLYHVNDTLSTIQSTAQASQHAEVIVGTGSSKLTSSMVTYLSELPNQIPAISFIPGSEKYVLCGPRDIMLVSTTSETSRWHATVNFGDYYHWMHWVIVTDNANMAVVLPRCTADSSKHSCIIGVVFVCMSDTSAEVYEKLTLLNTTNATLFYFDLKDDWLPRLVEWFPLWLADRPEFIYIVSLSPSSMTDLWTTLSVWETAGAQIWYDREIVIVAPYIQEWVRNTYGVYAGLYYALAMDSLELAVLAVLQARNGTTDGSTLYQAMLGISFNGVSGRVVIDEVGARVEQWMQFYTVNGSTNELDLLAEVSGRLGAVPTFSTDRRWYPGLSPPSGVLLSIPLIVVSDVLRNSGQDVSMITMHYMNALDAFNSNPTWLPGRVLHGQVISSAQLSNRSAFTVGALGPLTSVEAEFVSPFMHLVYGAPTLSLATTPSLMNMDLHPLFIRLMPSDAIQADFLHAVIQGHAWEPVCVLQDTSQYGQTLGYLLVQHLGGSTKVQVAIIGDFSTTTATETALNRILEQECRVVVGCIAGGRGIRMVLDIVGRRSVFGGRCWIFTDAAMSTRFAYPNDLGLMFSFPTIKDVQNYSKYNVFAAYAADAVYTYGLALSQMIELRLNIFDGRELWQRMTNETFDGLTGYVSFQAGERIGSYDLVNYVDAGGVGEYRVAVRSTSTHAPPPYHSAQLRAAARSSYAIKQIEPLVYPGNQTAFSNQVQYKLHWSGGLDSNTNFESKVVEGTSVSPYPTVLVTQADGISIAYRRNVTVEFFPEPVNASRRVALTTTSGRATFYGLEVHATRGTSLTMRFTTENAVNHLEARLYIQECEAYQYVANDVYCMDCPSGAVCNGTADVEAKVDHWRTGYYTADGTYVPNPNEYRFLRCESSACLGGIASACQGSNMGVMCGECVPGAVYVAVRSRCDACPWPRGVYALGYGLISLLYLAILAGFTWVVLLSVGQAVSMSPVVLKILVAYVQTLNLIVASGIVPSVQVTDTFVSHSLAELTLSGQAWYTFNCAFQPEPPARNFVTMFLPAMLAAKLLLLLAAVFCCRWVWTAIRRTERPTWRMFLPNRPGVAAFHEQPLSGRSAPLEQAEFFHEAVKPCSNCLRTASVTYCRSEGLPLCEPCNKALHPRGNAEKQAHLHELLDPRVGGLQSMTLLSAVCIIFYQAYVLTGVRTVYNLMQWWNCTPVFDNGAGTTAAYLSWATEQLCTGTEYYAILIANFVVVAFYAVGLPLRVIALLYPYRYRLGEEAVLMRHGWLYQGYHWFAYYWEAVMEVRKMIFVFITSIDPARIGILNKYCLMLLVCLGGIFINYAQAPFIWSLANTMDIYLLLACGVSCVVMIMYDGSTHRAQWALMGVNIGAFLVLLLIVYHRRPDLLTFAAFRAKQALLGLKRRLCCESKFELFEYQDPSWLDDDGCSACSDPALGERRDSPAVASHRLTAGAIRGGDTARCTTTPQGTTAASESESASSYDITCDTYDTYGDLVSSDPVVMEYLQEQVTREGFDLTGLSIAPPSSSASYGPFSARVQPLGSS